MKHRSKLQKIGWWATLWWAVSCFYILLVSGLSAVAYADISVSTGSRGFFSDCWASITEAYSQHAYLWVIFVTIIVVWLAGGVVWMRELKKNRISYKAAFKDLFLTIRK